MSREVREVEPAAGMFPAPDAPSLPAEAAGSAGALYAALAEALPDALLVAEQGGARYCLVNAGAERLLGYTREELLALGPRDVTAEEDRPQLSEIARSLRETGAWRGEWRVRRKDGSVVETEGTITAVPVAGETGRTLHQGIFRDLTVRRQAEHAQELSRLSAELTRSNAELERFAYVASHDLQEPLRMVVSYLQLIDRRYRDRLDSDGREFIEYAVTGGRRMQTLINDLLTYSRLGRQPGALRRVDCEALLDRVTRNLQEAMREAHGEITHDPLPEVTADPTQLGQVFQNLLANALKFRGEAPPRVHVSARRVDGWWEFSVRDNGIGIAPQDTDRIFTAFQRLHSRDRYPGSGIGLAIARRIVERHGGRIWAEPAECGAEFRFTLPATPAPAVPS